MSMIELGGCAAVVRHASHFVGTAALLQEADPPGQQSARPGRATKRHSLFAGPNGTIEGTGL